MLYEDDNTSTTTLNFAVKTTFKIDAVGLEGSVGGTLVYTSKDELPKQVKYKFDSFWGLNRVDQEGELYQGWPVRDKNAPVSFALADRTTQ